MQSPVHICQPPHLPPGVHLHGREMIFDTNDYPFLATPHLADMYWGFSTSTDDFEEDGAYMRVPPSSSEKQNSHTPSSSIGNIGPEISITTPGTTGSYVMVHKRAGSNVSNQTSAEGSESNQVVPPSHDSAEWTYTENTAEMDGDEDNYRMPHDPNTILFNMSGPESTLPLYNPYSPEAGLSPRHGNSPAPQQEYGPHMHASSHRTLNQAPNALSSYSGNPSMMGDVSDPPWTHITQPVRGPSQQGQGFFAFTPSSDPPAVEQEQVSMGSSVPLQIIEYSEGSTAKPKVKKEMKARRPRLLPKSKGKAPEHEWENHSVIQRGGLQLMTVPEEKPTQRSGIRKGKLDPDAAEKARKIRRITACWNCWMQKVPCSVGKPCDRCKKQCGPGSAQICLRTHFKAYDTVFFPEYLHAHFKKRKIEDLINEHTSGWTDDVLEVDIQTGACFTPLRLVVQVFAPKTYQLQYQDRLPTNLEQNNRWPINQTSAPIGLMGPSTQDLKEKCREHIDEMIENFKYAPQVTAEDVSRTPYAILVAAQKFYKATTTPLIGQTLMLHAIHYFLKSFPTLTEESVNKVLPGMEMFGAPREEYLSSRLLNRQIKYVMHKLSQELTTEVLEGLERTMRTRTKDSWGTAFCSFLVLCLCMEGLQIASDVFVVCDMQKEGVHSLHDRGQSEEACRLIDENPFSQCKKLFHDIYRSHRETQRAGREGAFNPLQSLANGGETGLDRDADAMVRSIYDVVATSWYDIVAVSENPPIAGDTAFGVDPNHIKLNGSGRLVGNFLRSFFPPNWRPDE